MLQENHYNIHNILKFKIVRNKCLLGKFLDLDYSFFKTQNTSNPDITINIGKFNPSNINCYSVDNKYNVKENYFYCKDSLGMTKWEMEIFGFEDGKTEINFNSKIMGIRNFIPCIPIQNFLLEALISYKLSEKGYFLIHSAGVSKNNLAYLLAGRGGAHKSRLSMEFINKGFDFLGDDKVIVNKNKVLSFPVNIIRFNFNYKHLGASRNNYLDRLRLLNYIRKSRNGEDDLLVKVGDSPLLKSIFFITRKDTQKPKIIKDLVPKKLVDKLILNSQIEMSLHGSSMPHLTGLTSNPFFKYMLVYSFVFPNSKIANYWENLLKKFSKIFKEIPFYEIDLPYKYEERFFKEIYNLTV